MSRRFDTRELHHLLAVVPGAPTTCPVCSSTYVPEEALHIICPSCYTRLRGVLPFRDIVLGIGCKLLIGELTPQTGPADATEATAGSTGARRRADDAT